MSASAVVRGLSGISLTEGAFRQLRSGKDAVPEYGSKIRVQEITNILRRSGYTVARLSTGTARRYGYKSPHFIPPTFLYKLRSGVTPHICQVIGLSESTGYRFVDWMRIFGFDMRQIPRLQVQLHPDRTVFITPVNFGEPLRPGFSRPRSDLEGLPGGMSQGFHLGANPRSSTGRYCFAKVGGRDALISPRLFPGMIVRVDRGYRQPLPGTDHSSLHDLLWLLEQPGGLTCSHLKWVGDDHVKLLPSRPPFGSLPLRLSSEVRVLGLVNLESGFFRIENLLPSPLPTAQAKMSFSGLLRAARGRTGLTFRAARRITESIASILGDPDCAIGLGLLSDYEAMDRLPRHIAKIVSLCITYCIDIRQLLETVGAYIDDSNKVPFPMLASMAPFPADYSDGVEQYRTTGLGPAA